MVLQNDKLRDKMNKSEVSLGYLRVRFNPDMVSMQELFNSFFSTTSFSCTTCYFNACMKLHSDAIDSLTHIFSIFQLIFSRGLYKVDLCFSHSVGHALNNISTSVSYFLGLLFALQNLW